MLTEERYSAIVRILESRGAASVPELAAALGSSESTVRRDLAALDAQNRIKKVHGGATTLISDYHAREYPAFDSTAHNVDEVSRIAQHAASLIQDYDLVFMDAGKTLRRMADFIKATNITVVTHGMQVAKAMAARGLTVTLTGGLVKSTTEALVGGEAITALQRYNFDIGFFGANGVSLDAGCTTPDADEARVKTMAMSHCRRKYLLIDSSKFGETAAVSFAALSEATIITGAPTDAEFRERAAIIEARA